MFSGVTGIVTKPVEGTFILFRRSWPIFSKCGNGKHCLRSCQILTTGNRPKFSITGFLNVLADYISSKPKLNWIHLWEWRYNPTRIQAHNQWIRRISTIPIELSMQLDCNPPTQVTFITPNAPPLVKFTDESAGLFNSCTGSYWALDHSFILKY